MGGKGDSTARRIVFGLSRAEDERSFGDFLAVISREELSSVLAERMSAAEMEEVVDMFSRLMRTHLSNQEYHQLFLGEEPHSR